MSEDMTDNEICERLRLKYIPDCEGFDPEHVDDYEHFLNLPRAEQCEVVDDLHPTKRELYVELLTSRAFYRTHEDRDPGSIIQAKVDVYPERYIWKLT